MGPAVTIIQDWPGAMKKATAAAYLEVSDSQFDVIQRDSGFKFHPFNLLPGGDARWSRDELDEFKEWRKRIGLEEKRRSA